LYIGVVSVRPDRLTKAPSAETAARVTSHNHLGAALRKKDTLENVNVLRDWVKKREARLPQLGRRMRAKRRTNLCRRLLIPYSHGSYGRGDAEILHTYLDSPSTRSYGSTLYIAIIPASMWSLTWQ